MECLEKHAWNRRYTREELEKLTVKAPDEKICKKVLHNLDHVAKPLDGLGRFEALAAQIGAIQRTENIDISRKAVIIMCADNGIVAEEISQSGQEVTLAVVKKMAEKKTSVGKMAETIRVDTIPVDIGVNHKSKIPGVLNKRICPGTKDYLIPSHKGKEPAMGRLAKELNVEPVIDANMALGEGTGAVMMFSLLDIALSVYQDRTTFSDINIEQYERFSHR